MDKMKKGKYIKKNEEILMISKGKKVRAVSLTIRNESKKRIHINGKEIKLLEELLEKMNLRNLK